MHEKSDKRVSALDGIVQRMKPVSTWDDLALPPEQDRILREIASALRSGPSRTAGLRALFADDDGTGKTMAAEVIANELHLDLYRIDLSAVVSKYIGETEKNLRKIFDTAEQSGAMLLFDEADALFGKRSEVKDSHDRYANIDINYLLQRIESYRGLAILATNRKNQLDQAFIRRMRYIIEFPSDIRDK